MDSISYHQKIHPGEYGHPYFLPQGRNERKCLVIFGEFSETTEVTVGIAMLSILGFDVHAISPDYEKNSPIVLSSHYYHDLNIAEAPLRAKHIYTSLDGKTCATTDDFEHFDYHGCDSLFLPGGSAPDYLQNDTRVLKIIESFLNRRRTTVMANCNGVKLLLGVLKGKNLSGPDLIKAQVNSSGNYYVNDAVYTQKVGDCTLITAGPLYYNYMFKEFTQVVR